MSAPGPDELVPNCVTCRQVFEEYGSALILKYKRKAAEDPTINVFDLIARDMRAVHEDHRPDDN